MKIVHIGCIELTDETGMGRISNNWRRAFEKNGDEFIHVGKKECPKALHHILWGKKAADYLKDNAIKPDLILVHEPAAGYFFEFNVPVVLFSHGIEARGWVIEGKYNYRVTTLKSIFLPTYFRYRANEIGLKKADKLLLSNSEDVNFAISNYKRKIKDVIIFKNGYYPENIPVKELSTKNYQPVTFLFNASWLERKGKRTMIEAFVNINKKFPHLWKLILAGVGNHREEILNEFPSELHKNLEIIPSYFKSEEKDLYEKSDVFILPSYFEGQSLALTQAMASGLCCICSDNCGQHDFIKHQENGLLFKTGDADDLTKQLEEILLNHKLIAQYAQHAKNDVKSYTWEKVSQEIVDICESLIRSQKSGIRSQVSIA